MLKEIQGSGNVAVLARVMCCGRRRGSCVLQNPEPVLAHTVICNQYLDPTLTSTVISMESLDIARLEGQKSLDCKLSVMKK
jgi:hypothetical protein